MVEDSFTEDLITEIISRVPAKHLLRFRCVSKSWCSLIRTDPSLSRLQRTASSSLDRPCLFIENINDPISGTCLFYNYWIDLDSIEDQSINFIEIHNPFDECPREHVRVVASCRGLLVLQQSYRPEKIAVYNPITRKLVMVPPNPAGDDNVVFFGFGYDRVHDCYKLLTRVKHRDYSLELMVYDLNKGTWKRLQFGMWWRSQFEDNDIDYYSDLYCERDDCDDAKCVDGAVYRFFNTDMGMKTMVCFLLAEEEFHVVKPPNLGYSTYMIVFDGKLGFMCEGFSTRREFWSVGMDYDDDGKRQYWRWTKLLEIWDELNYFHRSVFLIPVCFSACKNKILIFSFQGSQLFWYDVVEKEFSKLNDPINGRCQEGQLFGYDVVKKGVHKLDIPTDGCYNTTSFTGITII